MSGSDKLVRLQAVRRSVFWWTISRFLVLVFSKVWFRIRCEGADRLPKDGGVLLVANHSSYLDPGMVGITATRWVGFLAQAGLASLWKQLLSSELRYVRALKHRKSGAISDVNRCTASARRLGGAFVMGWNMLLMAFARHSP